MYMAFSSRPHAEALGWIPQSYKISRIMQKEFGFCSKLGFLCKQSAPAGRAMNYALRIMHYELRSIADPAPSPAPARVGNL